MSIQHSTMLGTSPQVTKKAKQWLKQGPEYYVEIEELTIEETRTIRNSFPTNKYQQFGMDSRVIGDYKAGGEPLLKITFFGPRVVHKLPGKQS